MTIKPKSNSSKEPNTMEELLALSVKKVRGFTLGDKIKGVVLAKTPKALFLDIGGKTEGVITEKAFVEGREFISKLNIGDEVTATVLVPETPEGYTLLSLRQAAFDATWDKLQEAKNEKRAVPVLGKAANTSGVTVELEGLLGFIPGSQLGKEVSKNTESLIGKYFKAIPIEVDRGSNKIVLSEKEISEAESLKEAKEALSKIKEGEVYDGEVTTVASFGCFVRLNLGTGKKKTYVEGLVHVSELSWKKVANPATVVKEGDKVSVKVIGLRDGKLALSIKGAAKDPWDEVEKMFTKDAKVTGKVTRISDFGTFVELAPGIEGLIHMTKIPPGTKLIEGQEVKCFVEEIDTKNRKLSLGLVLTSKPIGYK